MASKPKPIPDDYRGATPYLCMKDAARAIDFYAKAFGATETMRMTQPDGRIGHAEIRIGRAAIMLADEFPELDFRSPRPGRLAGEHPGLCRMSMPWCSARRRQGRRSSVRRPTSSTATGWGAR